MPRSRGTPDAKGVQSRRLLFVRILIWWAINFVALWFVAWLLDAVSYNDNIWALVLAAFVFGLVNLFLRPLLILLTLPLVILTFGLLLLVINALMLLLTAWIVPDFDVDGFWWAILAAVIVWTVNLILSMLLQRDRRERRDAPAY